MKVSVAQRGHTHLSGRGCGGHSRSHPLSSSSSPLPPSLLSLSLSRPHTHTKHDAAGRLQGRRRRGREQHAAPEGRGPLGHALAAAALSECFLPGEREREKTGGQKAARARVNAAAGLLVLAARPGFLPSFHVHARTCARDDGGGHGGCAPLLCVCVTWTNKRQRRSEGGVCLYLRTHAERET